MSKKAWKILLWQDHHNGRLQELLDCLACFYNIIHKNDPRLSGWFSFGLDIIYENSIKYAGLPFSEWPRIELNSAIFFAIEMALASTSRDNSIAGAIQGEGCWKSPQEFARQWAMVAAQMGSRLGESYAVLLAARENPKAYAQFLRYFFYYWRKKTRKRKIFVIYGKERINECKSMMLEMGLLAVAHLEDRDMAEVLAKDVAQYIQEQGVDIPLSLFPLQCELDKVLKSSKLYKSSQHLVVLRSMQEPTREDERHSLDRLRPLLSPLPLAQWPKDLYWTDVLYEEFPWMDKAVRVVERQQALSQNLGSERLHFRPLLLLGPSGVGKTRFLRRLGELLGVPTIFIPLAGSQDSMMLKGAARGWSSARPGLMVEKMVDTKCPNPVVILDEIDKIGLGRQNGRVWETLLTLLEPSSSSSVLDEFLLGEVNYSAISWVATANDLSDIPVPLISRFEIISVDTPKADHFNCILKNMLQDVAREYGQDSKNLPVFDPEVLDILRRQFTRNHYSLRYLRRAIFRVMEIQALENRKSTIDDKEEKQGPFLQ